MHWSLLPLMGIVISSVASGSIDTETIVRECRPAIVTVHVYGSLGGKVGTGSGFLINEDEVVTNHHVINGASAAKIEFLDGRTIPVADLVASSVSQDLAILRLEAAATDIKPLVIRASPPRDGEAIIVIGNPLARFAGMVSTGTVTGLRDGSILYSSQTAPGSSGGPLLDSGGQVVGVHKAASALAQPEWIKFATPSTEIANLDRSKSSPLHLVVSDFDTLPIDVPEAFLEQVDPRQHEFLARIAPYYVRLPDGSCISLIREFHVWHEENDQQGFPTLADAVAFGYDIFTSRREPKPDRRITAVEAPYAKSVYSKYFIATGLRLESRVRLEGALEGDFFLARLVNFNRGQSPGVFCVIGVPEELHGDGEIYRPAVLWRAGKVKVPGQREEMEVFQYIDALLSRPTPVQLAFAAANGKAELVSYSVTQSSHQPKRKTGSGWNVKWVSSGPLQVTYKWNQKPVQLRMRTRPPTSPVDTKSPAPSQPDRAVAELAVHEIIRLRDGREFRGRLISENDSEIVFEVVIGRVASRLRFAPHEVLGVEPVALDDEQR